MEKEKPIYCADAIAIYNGKIVIVERLSSVKGFALPGGKQDVGENLTETVVREVCEETGLVFVPGIVFGTYAEDGRDPRGSYVSTIFVGSATGTIKNEEGKTKVSLVDRDSFLELRKDFRFDHGDILEAYFARY